MAFILTLLTNICAEAMPFAFFIMCIVIGFVKIYALFHMGYDEDSLGYNSTQVKDDEGIPIEQIQSDLIKRSIVVYMNIAGTVTAPIMTEEKYEEIHGNWLYMLLMFGSIIFFWISQQMLFGVAGTFFVSMVFQSYEK